MAKKYKHQNQSKKNYLPYHNIHIRQKSSKYITPSSGNFMNLIKYKSMLDYGLTKIFLPLISCFFEMQFQRLNYKNALLNLNLLW